MVGMSEGVAARRLKGDVMTEKAIRLASRV